MAENLNARLRLEETLRSLAEHANLDGLTLWRVQAGWQASARDKGSDGFSIAVRADPIQAIEEALFAKFQRQMPEFIGLGPNGPVSPAMKRLAAALADNAAVREAIGL